MKNIRGLVVLGRRGKLVRVDRCFLPGHVKPLRGWGVTIEVKKLKIGIDGVNPMSVFRKASAVLADNDASIPDGHLWLNLNIKWAEVVPEARLPASRDDLAGLAKRKKIKLL
jgi:hypothetical protein